MQINEIGIIGCGLVGSMLAKNLIAASFRVVGYDIKAEQMEKFQKLGGIVAHSPAEVAQKTSYIILSLLNSDIVKIVIEGPEGILQSPKYPKYIIDTTTGDPQESTRLGQDLTEKGICYIDTPISGSSQEIAEKKGIFLVGGSKVISQEILPILNALTNKIIYTGPIGSAMKAKLAINLVIGLNRAALAEGLIFAEAIGIPLPKALELFHDSFAYSKVLDMKGHRMISEDFTPAARISQHYKDVQLILHEAEKNAQYLPFSSLHAKLLEHSIAAGDGDLDNSSIIKQLRRESHSPSRKL